MTTEQDKTFIALKYGSLDLAYEYWQEKVDISRAGFYLTHELTKFFTKMSDEERLVILWKTWTGYD